MGPLSTIGRGQNGRSRHTRSRRTPSILRATSEIRSPALAAPSFLKGKKLASLRAFDRFPLNREVTGLNRSSHEVRGVECSKPTSTSKRIRGLQNTLQELGWLLPGDWFPAATFLLSQTHPSYIFCSQHELNIADENPF